MPLATLPLLAILYALFLQVFVAEGYCLIFITQVSALTLGMTYFTAFEAYCLRYQLLCSNYSKNYWLKSTVIYHLKDQALVIQTKWQSKCWQVPPVNPPVTNSQDHILGTQMSKRVAVDAPGAGLESFYWKFGRLYTARKGWRFKTQS